ncbi:dual specificity protein phosphatase MPK-4-like isoform X2 [Scylla paramamosain]
MDDNLLPDTANLDMIEEGLYLGNLTAAIDTKLLGSLRVSHILTVESNPLPTSITSLPGMSFMYIKVDDMYHEDLLSYFEDAFSFIKDGQEKGNVLVHCYFGMSRSATLVTCFLMKKYKLCVAEALQSSVAVAHLSCVAGAEAVVASDPLLSPVPHWVCRCLWLSHARRRDRSPFRVKLKRHCVGPNSGFLAQLATYEVMGWTLDSSNVQYGLYKLQAAARSVMIGETQGLDSKHQSVVHPNPNIDADQGPVAYKCRSCRLSLISLHSLVFHCPGETPLWTDPKWSGRLAKLTLCDKGIFTFPITWMGDLTESMQGKLHCPKCHAKLGSFSWHEGHRCSCEARITPAFYFIPSKLDKCF